MPCSVLQHMSRHILSTLSHVFSSLRELIWLSLAVPKDMTVALAFLHFPGKNPQPPKHLTGGMQAVLSQLRGAGGAEQSGAAQELQAEPRAVQTHTEPAQPWAHSSGQAWLSRDVLGEGCSRSNPAALGEPIQLCAGQPCSQG